MRQKKWNIQGFTLVELLTVVVILGIIISLAVPALRNLTYNNSEKEYQYLQKEVHEAVKLYAKNYRGELRNDSSSCFNIPYKTLLKEGLIEEENVTCDGSIILEKRSNSGYNYNYYLTCKDASGEVIHESDPIPFACKGFSGKFKIDYALYQDGETGQVPYTEGDWTKYIYGEYNASSPYNYPIERIEYSTDFINWNTMTNQKQTYTNYNGNVFARAVDTGGNSSEAIRHLIRGDSLGPSFVLNNNEHLIQDDNTMAVNINNVTDHGVGVDSHGDAYSFDGVNWSSVKTKNIAIGSEESVFVKDKLGNVSVQTAQVIRACSGGNATATRGDILTGKTAWINGEKLTGSMANNGSVKRTLNPGDKYTIPKGYHDGTGVITITSLASNTSADAKADQILKDRTAWINGVKVTGSMANNGSVKRTLNPGDKYTIPKGYHDGTGVVTVTNLASNTSATAKASEILSGKTAWVNGKMITGTMAEKGQLNWSGVNTTYTVPAGYYSGGTIDSRASYQKGVEDGQKMVTIQTIASNTTGTSLTIDLPNCGSLTKDNFILELVGIKARRDTCSGCFGGDSYSVEKTYDASTCKLSWSSRGSQNMGDVDIYDPTFNVYYKK